MSIRIIYLVVFLGVGQILCAQSNAFMSSRTNSPHFYEFSETNKIIEYEPSPAFKPLVYLSLQNLVAEHNGTPQFIDMGYGVHDAKNGELIPGTDGIVPAQGKLLTLQVSDSVFHLIHVWSVPQEQNFLIQNNVLEPAGLESTFLDTITLGVYAHHLVVGKGGIRFLAKNIKITESNELLQVIDVKRISDYKYLILTSGDRFYHTTEYSTDSFNAAYMYTYDTNGLVLRDSLVLPLNLFSYPPPWPEDSIRSYGGGGGTGELSFNCDKLFFTSSADITGKYIGKTVALQRIEWLIDIDTLTYTFTSVNEVNNFVSMDLVNLQRTGSYRANGSLLGWEFSPNDSILYLGEHYRVVKEGKLVGPKEYSLIKAWRYREEPRSDAITVDSLSYDRENRYQGNHRGSPSVLSLTPWGGIGLGNDKSFLVDSKVEILNTYDVFANANNPRPFGFNTRIINEWNRKDGEHGLRYVGLNIYQFIKLKKEIVYDCEARVQIENKSDLSGGMSSFTWYFTREDGGTDTINGFEPNITYVKSGDYPFKCYGYSPKGKGYGEWYIDTLKIRIPEKPVAAFRATDTVVCAFSKAEFINQSTTDTIHPTNGEKWVWTFGDGETQTVILPFGEDRGGASHVSHIYKAPGTYTVSLFYSNGFCDSTLTKNQYITVVDAPAPGFSIDNNRGCSPFTVNVTDTVTKNTVKKEIIYGDGTRDSFFAVSLPPWGRAGVGAIPHQYTQPGNYWLVQRLYGYTGCITQLDSVRIYVTPGFTEADTSHITNATYQDVPAHPVVPEIITVNWPCLLEGADVSYHLYRNNQKIAELDSQLCIYGQIVYLDSLEQASKSPLTYTVRVIDSCGTATQVGRVGQPVHVSGKIVGNNELSIITYTAYQDWNVGESELRYELQTENNLGGWETINDPTGTAAYSDQQFLDITKEGIQLEKCYRVIANGTNQTSISNILCLPYTPVIFLPTAFSPNGDNLNDVYRPVTFGIEHYQMKIYNRYGEKIAEFTEQDGGWQAIDAPLGAYMVTIRAKGTDNEWYTLKQTVTVVR